MNKVPMELFNSALWELHTTAGRHAGKREAKGLERTPKLPNNKLPNNKLGRLKTETENPFAAMLKR